MEVLEGIDFKETGLEAFDRQTRGLAVAQGAIDDMTGSLGKYLELSKRLGNQRQLQELWPSVGVHVRRSKPPSHSPGMLEDWLTYQALREEYHRKMVEGLRKIKKLSQDCLLYTSPSPRDRQKSRMPSSA